MSPRLKLSGVRSSNAHVCQKPNCLNRHGLQRHHMRSERMFVRNCWRYNCRKKWYKEMVVRYEEFRPEDVVLICSNHHEEIHVLYENVVFAQIKSLGYRPIESFTHDEVLELQAALYHRCQIWLAKETPGLQTRRYVG